MSKDINLTEGTITEVLNDKVDIDFNNVPTNSVGFARCSTEVTNCITEIPQRIKLELNNGTLTLKAGSVVTVPYGTEDRTAEFPIGSKFLNDYFEVYETSWDGEKFFVYAKNNVNITNDTAHTVASTTFNYINMLDGAIYRTVRTESGTGSPSTTYCGYYNTDTNLVKPSDSTTSYVNALLTLPLFIASSTESDTTWYGTINQVFNGMGYIGSTVWLDKGVKGLIPNGRNEDGSYNNEFGETTRISMLTNPFGASDSGFSTMFLFSKDELVGVDEGLGLAYKYVVSTVEPSGEYITWYNPQTNLLFYRTSASYAWQRRHMTPCMSVKYNFENNTKKVTFTGLIPKQPFRALDYNNKSEISGWGMPSSKYIDLTLGASDTTYTAPANGWFSIRAQLGKETTTVAGYIGLYNETKSPIGSIVGGCFAGNSYKRAVIPCMKGEIISVFYNNLTTYTPIFRFYYAEGEV